MCGVVGSVGPPVDLSEFVRALRHRGPDDSGVYADDGVTLGHTRLAVLDLSEHGAQPMVSGEAAIVFNGEIYNHRALRSELQSLGHTFKSHSDTEVILEGFRQWGEGVVERLDGMFAFAAWERGTLLLARDRVGKKPLFYAALPDRFVFASEIKALPMPRVFDPAQLPMLLTFGYVPAPHTLYQHVRQLPPATLLTFTNGRIAERRYWKAPFDRQPREGSAHSVRALVEQAVERRLEADVPLGAFLSGGVDSSIVVGVMRQMLGRVRTFSIGFAGDPRYDETKYARIAAKAFDTEHTEFTLEPSSFGLVEKLVQVHDGPFGDASAIPTSVVSMLTRQHVKVALSGDGGDELFCGYSRFLAAAAAERLPRFSVALPPGRHMKSLYSRASRFLRTASRPLGERLCAWSGYFVDDLSELLGFDTLGPLHFSAEHAQGASTMQKILAHNFETYLPYDLLVKTDRSAMLHGLEVRSPFLDTALIEYAAQLPESQLHRGLQTKWILKKAFSHLLPRAILNRGKMGFGVPLGTWFRGDLREHLHDHLGGDARIHHYVRENYVRRLLADHDAGHADHGLKLWLLLTFEVWLKQLGKV